MGPPVVLSPAQPGSDRSISDRGGSPRPRRGLKRDIVILVAILISAALAALFFLEIPISHEYSGVLLSGEREFDVATGSKVSVSWASNGPFCPTFRCGWIQVAILPSPNESLSSALNPTNFAETGTFTFTASSGVYYLWMVRGAPDGLNFQVSYSATLL
jgi:hypothetical protein